MGHADRQGIDLGHGRDTNMYQVGQSIGSQANAYSHEEGSKP